jgi:hypothetical protein
VIRGEIADKLRQFAGNQTKIAEEIRDNDPRE